MDEIEPRKSFYQICVTEKATDRILYANTLSAWNEVDAIQKTKIGSVIQNKGFIRDDVDFYIRNIGVLYDGDTFAEALAQTPALTEDEIVQINVREAYKLCQLYGLRQEQLETYIESNITTLASAKEFLKKLAAVVLWLVKQSRLDE